MNNIMQKLRSALGMQKVETEEQRQLRESLGIGPDGKVIGYDPKELQKKVDETNREMDALLQQTGKELDAAEAKQPRVDAEIRAIDQYLTSKEQSMQSRK